MNLKLNLLMENPLFWKHEFCVLLSIRRNLRGDAFKYCYAVQWAYFDINSMQRICHVLTSWGLGIWVLGLCRAGNSLHLGKPLEATGRFPEASGLWKVGKKACSPAPALWRPLNRGKGWGTWHGLWRHGNRRICFHCPPRNIHYLFCGECSNLSGINTLL